MLEQILWTACITPFEKGEKKVDYKSLEKSLRNQDHAGNGMLIFGSTGEGMALSEQEKKEILDFAFSLNLKEGIMVGIGGHNLQSCIELIEYANKFPIKGFLFTTPIYTKPGIKGQTYWFKTLLDKTDKMAMLYNIPSRAGVKLHSETVMNLSNNSNFVAIKDSGGSVASVIDYRKAAPEIKVYCGDDAMMASMAAEGAVGLISVASNAWPELTRKYVSSILKKEKIDTSPWWELSEIVFCSSNPIPIKKIMEELGQISNAELRPPLTIEELNGKILINKLPLLFR